jgi:DNA-binding CsgD family transcriptional regulator
VRWEAAGTRWLAAAAATVDVGTIVTLRREGRTPAAIFQTSLGISDREAQVLALIAQGQTSAGVARNLGISVRTVHKHLEHLYRSLGVSSKGDAVAIARCVTEDFHSGA